MSALIVVKPIAVTDSMLISCSVPETDYGAYVAGTTYALADRVIITTGVHSVYESMQAGNLGHDPTLAVSAAWWKKVSATNAWKCLDTKVSTQTVQAGTMSYRIRPGKVVNAVYVGNGIADSVRIRMIDPVAGTVYDKTTSMLGTVRRSRPFDWYFSRRARKSKFLALDLPNYYGADVLVDLVAASGNVSVGLLMMGYQQAMGVGIKFGVRVGMTDYSQKTVNTFGDTELVPLNYADKADFDLVVKNTEIDSLKDELTALRATPCLVIGTSVYTCTVVFGWIGDFEIIIPYVLESDCTISWKGLT